MLCHNPKATSPFVPLLNKEREILKVLLLYKEKGWDEVFYLALSSTIFISSSVNPYNW